MKDNIKIGIINHWMVNNYGALFLAYALERKIRELGYEVETITWLPDEVKKPWKLSMVKKTGFLTYFLRLGYFGVYILPREKKFKSFRKLMQTSDTIYCDDTLCKIADQYDKVVVGGDQLWNCKINYFNRNNFLPFIKEKGKKVAYAASLSQDFIREGFKEEFKYLVEDFSYVTVRETRAKELIEENTSLRVERVSDSAFLLNKKEWMQLAKFPKEENYIFVYQVQSDILLIDFAKKLAKIKNLMIVYCPFPLKKQIKCKRKPYLSPEEWLGYMSNAKYIVTDAFHGAVFSIIFNKDFFVEISEYGKDTGSRITNILDIYSLQNRLLTVQNKDTIVYEQSINYDLVNKIIEQEKEDAVEKIKEMLEYKFNSNY